LRGHPASENVAIRICVLGHGDGLNHQLAFGFVAHLKRIIAQPLTS